MKTLAVVLESGEIAILRPTPYLQLGVFYSLYSKLLEYWEWSGKNIGELMLVPNVVVLIKQIINLLPRADLPNRTGFELGEEFAFLDEFLFSDLPQLHECEEIISTAPVNEDWVIPSSGDKESDMLADFAHQHGGGAIALLERFDLNTLNHVVARNNEINRDPEERIQQELELDFNAWKEQNPNAYRESLGLPIITA